jgi:glycosyltransferase involved in cell wall biosynthesis
MKNLTLVIPAKKESESLPKVLDEIYNLGLNCKIKICLDKDDIETINAINKFAVEIFFQNEKGYGAALIEGINSVDTELFCIFNADGSFNPNELKKMLDLISDKNFDFVFASRYLKNAGSDDDNLITLIGNYFFSYIGKIFFKLNISDILYTYVLGKTDKFKEINFKKKDFGFCVEFPIKCSWNKLKLTDVASWERPRIAGKKKVNAMKDGTIILFDLIKLFFSKNV